MRIGDAEFNRLKVLKAIRRCEPVARTDLVQSTGLTPGTITVITADLVRRGVLTEKRTAAVERGRPRVLLSINPQGAHALAAFFGVDGKLATEIVNLRGEVVFARQTQMPAARSIEAMLQSFGEVIAETIRISPYRKSDIHHVGLALPALIDANAGIVHWVQTFEPQPASAATILQKRLRLPVAIDNSIDALARAEHWFGASQLDSFSLVKLGLTVALARYVDGSLFIGTNGLNPEFGHVKVVTGGRPCLCGARGCLGVHTGAYGLIAHAFELRKRPLPAFSDFGRHLQEIAADARRGNSHAKAAFEMSARVLGVALANHVNECDPGRVIVLTTDPVFKEFMEAPFRAALQADMLHVHRARTVIDWRTSADDPFHKGVAALLLEHIYRNPGGRGARQPR